MTRSAFFLVGAALLVARLVVACHPTPAPLPPDASDAAPPRLLDASHDASASSVNACAHLDAIGCPDGAAANCAAVLDHVRDSRLTRIDVACILTAHDPSEARECGSVCR
jgi:hypothetical protein